jgi:hypothetical protein
MVKTRMVWNVVIMISQKSLDNTAMNKTRFKKLINVMIAA